MAGLVKDVNEKNFQKEVLDSELPVLVDFWAEWCGPCKMIAPIIEELAKNHEEALKIVKLNIDDSTSIASKYKVLSIPTLILFKNGEALGNIIGSRSIDAMETFIKETLASA